MRAMGGLRTSEFRALQDIDAYRPTRRILDLVFIDEKDGVDRAEGADPGVDTDASEQLLTLMDNLTLDPLGSWATSDFVKVDETKWFKLFRRERWSSYKHTDPNGLSIDIDDDATWAKLGRTIEIANRILTEAVSHEWLASFLKQDSREFRRDVKVGAKLGAPRTGTIVRVKPVSPDSRLSQTEARKVLDDIADCFFWGFYLREEYPGVIGKTTRYINKSGKQLKWMCVGLEYFQPLFQDKTFQDPEGRQAIMMVAKTFWDEERWAEAGISWEMSFFGFSLKDTNIFCDNRYSLHGIRAPWPAFCLSSSGHMDVYDYWSIEEPFQENRYGIPAISLCAMTTSDFWETHVPKYGYKALRYKGLCVAEQVWENNYERATRTARARILDAPYSEYGRLDVGLRMIARRLRLRRMELRKLRPWYKAEFLFQAYAYLWLATLPARKKPTPFTDQTSRTQYPERLSIPKSAGGQEIIDLVTERERKQSAPTTQYLYNANILTHDKEMCMANARLAFLRWGVLGDVSHEVAQGFNEDWRDVRRMIDQYPYNHEWLTCPGTSKETLHCPIGGSQVEKLPLKKHDLNDADLPSWAVAKPAIAPSTVPSRGKSAKVYSQLHHYHVGEIGDHQRVGSGVKWFVHTAHDDDRYLIYDFSGRQSKHGWDAVTREQLTMR
ncbi:hypothetical protein BDP81DRAFT_361379, partial [Colletotrichum phormii]